MEEIQQLILSSLERAGEIEDSVAFAHANAIDHVKLTGQALSLESSGIINKKVSVPSMFREMLKDIYINILAQWVLCICFRISRRAKLFLLPKQRSI